MVIKGKKGLSMIVSTLLIILLVLVALGIIWAVVRNVLSEGSEDVELGKFFIDLQVKQAYLNGNDLVVGVERGSGEGELSGMSFVFEGESSSEVVSIDENLLNELESRTYTFDNSYFEGLTVGDIISVSVAPIYIGSSGNSGSTSLGEATRSIIVAPEPPEGTALQENCGNGNIDVGEVCDGLELGGVVCSDYGYNQGEGTLMCSSDCTSFDFTSCVGGAACQAGVETGECGLQFGVCAGSIQTCTAEGTWPGCDYLAYNSSYNASGETGALCTDGLDNDCNNLLDNAEATCEYTWTGTVNDPWPSTTNLLFIVEETTADFITPSFSYIGMKIGFSGTSAETRCIQIMDYILPFESELFDNSIVSLDENIDLPINIATGDTFTIYQKSDCGF